MQILDEHIADGYFSTRLVEDPRRQLLWQILCEEVFQHYVPPKGVVLELGAGRADFINNIRSERRVALDVWEGVTEAVSADVEPHVGRATDLSFLEDGSVDVVFASNLVEHLSIDDAREMFNESRRVLKRQGRLILVQPNYRLSFKRYFDDYTHVSVWTDVSIADFLRAEGFEVERVTPRFLPLTLKSRIPVHPLLIRAYLASPIKPMAGQMLVVARRDAP